MRPWILLLSLMLLPALGMLGCEETDDDDVTDDDTADDDDVSSDDDDDTADDDDDSATDDDDSADDDDDTGDDDTGDDDTGDDDTGDDDTGDDDTGDDDTTEPTEPDIGVNPASINVGTLCVGMALSTTFDISNLGTADLDVTSVTTLAPAVNVSFNTPATLPPGTTQSVGVDVACNAEVTIQAQITIESNDPDENPLQVMVTGDCDEC